MKSVFVIKVTKVESCGIKTGLYFCIAGATLLFVFMFILFFIGNLNLEQ